MKSILLLPLLYFMAIPAGTHPKAWHGTPQSIPGRVECELYDEGGPEVAYHDNDSVNNGSGKLNPVNGNPLNKFRIKEGVDISYTKSGGIDDTEYDKVKRDIGQLYVGWTEPGEWINYTVNVKESAKYRIDLMYTSNRGGSISFDIDGKKATDPLKITTTNDSRDTIAWRQWHHWNMMKPLGEIDLKKGIHILKLRVVENGNMNFDYLEFVKMH
jgi:hypothetical protein